VPPLVRQWPGLAGRSAAEPPALAIAGYSFGSFVGGQAASTDPRVHLYLGIAPPLNRYDFGFLRAARCRIALIGATRDEFCDPARLEALVAGLPGSPWVRFLETDHFFADALDDLAAACAGAIAGAG
jgi:alpha/beta superfamily hydrolase